ncbi:phosphotransferase family protein [Glycomyces sp. NPDC048151]|uniref:phosphotransferase family protein n=1 Tax=Glycomyces sp. NPDC048151 TaxID=3364002 RepID=UPI0037154304
MWKPRIDAASARERIAEEIGAVTEWEAITEGENSQAYRAVADGRQVVVRVNLRREGFDLDAWAAKILPGQGVTVPEVVAVGAIGEAWFCVSTRLEGERLCDLDGPAVAAAAPAVAEALRRINATPLGGTEGYGGIDPATGNGRGPTWSSAVAWGVPRTWDAVAEQADREFLETASAAVLAEADALPDFGRLVHGDYSADNLIVSATGEVGVIDWEGAMIGDPLWDVAYQLFWSAAWPVMLPQARAALPVEPSPEELERLRCYMVVAGLRSASFYVSGSRKPELDLMLDRLRAMPEAPATAAELLSLDQ